MIHIKEKLVQFKSILNVVTNLGIETNLTFMPEGVYINIVNLANIAMIKTIMKKSMFEQYDIQEEKTFTVDNKTLMLILNKLGKKELFIDLKPAGIEFKNEKNDKLVLKYYVGQKEERKIPDVPDAVTWKLNPGELINELGESVEFGNIGIFTGTDKLLLKLKAQLVEGDINISATKLKGDTCDSYYDMGEFIYISAIRHIFKEGEFGYTTDICYLTCDNDEVYFKWVLAARVPDND